MRATRVHLVDMTPRWGLVTVMAEDTSIVRQYQITGEDVAAIRAGANPPGCTADEWKSGRVLVQGRPCLPGMGVKNPDGTLMVNYGIEEVSGRIDARVMKIPSSEWLLLGDVVHIVASVADEMGV